MQPTLAPAPTPPHQHMSGPGAQVQPSYLKEENVQILIDGWEDQQETAEAEQALRVHLLHNIANSPPKAVNQSPPDQTDSTPTHDDNMNIDPAISGVGVSQHAPPQTIVNIPPQHPQIPQQHVNQIQHQTPPPQNIHMTGTSPEMGSQGSPEGDDSTDAPKRGSKRELSTSKRAAQNRAAQRAFRQRKEGYIKKLEEQVRDLANLEESYKAIQNENYQLRDYIISLQSRLIESQGEDAVPPAPILITHQQPPPPPPPQQQQQQQQQALPSHLMTQQPPQGPPAMGHVGQPQVQTIQQHVQPQAVPTAPMSVNLGAPPQAQMIPQATMVSIQQKPQQTIPLQQQQQPQHQQQQQQHQQQQQQQQQQVQQQQHQQHQQQQQSPLQQQAQIINNQANGGAVENVLATAKRVYDDEAAYNGYVAKKLRGESADPPPSVVRDSNALNGKP
ncbi:hypothetical protein DFH27DRAFT_133950 [Peziza echinospora]|nr:hypothetical protein DFH27DRAFT_133950 [Peziza echinospora]